MNSEFLRPTKRFFIHSRTKAGKTEPTKPTTSHTATTNNWNDGEGQLGSEGEKDDRYYCRMGQTKR